MVDGILNFFTNIYEFLANTSKLLANLWKTFALIPALAGRISAYVPYAFVFLLGLGVMFIIAKFVKDLL